MAENSSSSRSFKDLEQSGWQAKAEGYDKLVVKITAQAIEATLDAAAVSDGKQILEVACGPGIGVRSASARGATTIGVDFAASMVELASRNFPGGDFREGDGENLPFTEASFDAVICMFGLLHMSEPERAIAEAHRVLRPGGRYAFTVWDNPESHEFFAVVMNAIQTFGDLDVPLPPAPPFFRFSEKDECKKVLAEAGFNQINVRSIPLTWTGRSGLECLDLIKNGSVRTAMLLEYQSPEVQENIQNAIVDGVEKFKKGDEIQLAWPAVLASATKP